MGAEENEAVVRRFMNPVLAGGDLDVADEVLAPTYVNVAMGGADLAGVKAIVAATSTALREQRFEDEELVADGDVVFARFNYIVTLPDGSTATARALAYYRLADSRIVLNDVMFLSSTARSRISWTEAPCRRVAQCPIRSTALSELQRFWVFGGAIGCPVVT